MILPSYTGAMNRPSHSAQRQQGRTAPQPPTAIQTMAAQGLAHHQRGQLAEAEALYRKILALDPNHADTLHLLGVLAHQVGRNGVAVEMIGRAIEINKRPAAYHSNLGTALQALDRLDEAAESYQRALDRDPQLAQARMNLGVVRQAQGDLVAAEACFRRALALCPDLAEAHVNLGCILQAQGKLEQAAASHERALELRPEFLEARFNLGNTRQAQGRLDEAVAHYERAIALQPQKAEVYGNLGNALQAQHRLDEAVASYQRALELKPNYAEACYNLGNARQAQSKLEEAVACFQSALELKPDLPQAHYNLGNTLHTLDRLDEAAASFTRALGLDPRYAHAHYNLGCVLREQGCLAESLSCIAKALEVKPDYPQAQFGLALTQLQAGDFDHGWSNYESRWRSTDHDTPWRPYPQPLWDGKKLEQGRLLLWGEQGIGDEIQFAGLLPDALRTGNRIVLDCDARLKPLLARSFPKIEVVRGLTPATSEELDLAAHLPVGSLPALFRSTEAAFATGLSPYLLADPAQTEGFRAQYSAGRPLVGLAWSTKNQKSGRKRSISLDLLAPLFALGGARWVSLQYGAFDELEEQTATAHAPLLIDRGVDQFADIDRFAAQIAAMDLVVTIDNSTAHLAGALGRPVFLLLPHAADWRWMQSRSESPWYPTLRLFRQPTPGDWASVVQNVRAALAERLYLGSSHPALTETPCSR